MDDAFGRLMPTQRFGYDGFPWWVGQVEGTASDEENNKGGYRYKVRIVGDHPSSREILDTKDLPWATVMMPVNIPFMPGNIGGGHPQLIPGCWVTGFYLDADRQKPIILGSIGVVPGATSTINDIEPNTTKAFITGVRSGVYQPNPTTDGEEGKDGTAKTGGGLSDGTTRGDGEERVDAGTKKNEVIKDEDWCQTIAETGQCKDVPLKKQLTTMTGNFLRDIQNSNGNVGTYYTSKITGRINNSVGDARSYVNKAISVVTEFLAKIKGMITLFIQDAVSDLVRGLLRYDKDGNGNVLTPVTEWFNGLIKDLGCKMADLGDRLAEWLTNVLMSFINQIYRAAICQIDELVNGIISKIQQLLNELLSSILGPLQDILGAIAEPLNVIGNAINYILRLLGIECTGPDQTCAKYKQICTSGEKKDDDDDEKGFLDKLLEKIGNINTPSDYTQYVCEEAYTGNPLTITTVGFAGGVPLPPTSPTKKPKIAYDISDITVTEGESATFTVTRTGFLDNASSVKFKTLKSQGTATAGSDYLPQEGILGFSPDETEKTITIQTLVDTEKEAPETFFIRLTTNSPVDNSEVKTVYINNIGKCTIIEQNLKDPYDPYKPDPSDPFELIDDPSTGGLPDNPNTIDDGTGDGDGDVTPTYQVTANRTTCPEDEFIIYTITTTNVDNGTILYYNLYGNNITAADIVGGITSAGFVVNDNTAKVTVGIAEDNTIEDVETLTFNITGKGASVDVLITTDSNQNIGDLDEGIGDTPETVFEQFRTPTVNIDDVITDDTGGIIEIPVDDPGDAWAEPPIVFVGGEGTGATATALLDGNGFLTEIRVQSPGFGYKKNLASDNDVRCIIDSFTILRPGIGYTSVPDMYVNGELGIAEAVIDPDTGFVVGARILNRELTFEKFPAIDIVGGGGYGAKLLPSLACLDTEALSTIGSTKIGTGKYIDCP